MAAGSKQVAGRRERERWLVACGSSNGLWPVLCMYGVRGHGFSTGSELRDEGKCAVWCVEPTGINTALTSTRNASAAR